MKSRGQKGRKSGGVQNLSLDLRIILVDQVPLRERASAECNKEMARLERLQAELRRYEQKDRPAFDAWIATTFGALRTRLRETMALIREKEALIREVESLMFFEGVQSYKKAYAAVMREREELAELKTKPPSEDEAPEEAPPEMPEEEQRFRFEEYIEMVFGLNPHRLNPKDYARMFAEFREEVLGYSDPKKEPEPAPEPRREPLPRPEPPTNDAARIKEIYRILVRRLHPDTRPGSDPVLISLWHDVQNAYDKNDLERLEMLLALTDIRAEVAGTQTSLSQMRSVVAELRRSVQALNRSLHSFKKDPAWNFSAKSDRSAFQKGLERQFQRDLATQERILGEMTRLIESWAPPSKKTRPKKSSR